jgi:hypothetical protein
MNPDRPKTWNPAMLEMYISSLMAGLSLVLYPHNVANGLARMDWAVRQVFNVVKNNAN